MLNVRATATIPRRRPTKLWPARMTCIHIHHTPYTIHIHIQHTLCEQHIRWTYTIHMQHTLCEQQRLHVRSRKPLSPPGQRHIHTGRPRRADNEPAAFKCALPCLVCVRNRLVPFARRAVSLLHEWSKNPFDAGRSSRLRNTHRMGVAPSPPPRTLGKSHDGQLSHVTMT